MIHRCLYCSRLIWPWQPRGHYVREDRSLLRWHAAHISEADAEKATEELIGFIVKDGLRR